MRKQVLEEFGNSGYYGTEETRNHQRGKGIAQHSQFIMVLKNFLEPPSLIQLNRHGAVLMPVLYFLFPNCPKITVFVGKRCLDNYLNVN